MRNHSTYNLLNSTDIEFFHSILPPECIKTDKDSLEAAAKDYTEDFSFLPAIVLFPRQTREVASIMKHCFQRNLPVTPRGAGTGLSGGALPVYGGVVLAMAKMNKVLHLDENNLQVSVQPGIITQQLQELVESKGLFYPPDPSSRGSSFIGGNLAESSGGPRAVKYGVSKDYVLNLEVVLPNGTIMETGAKVLKNATGYNLTQLMVGSEGTLGIITRIDLRLIPLPKMNWLMLVPFVSPEKACEAVSAVFRAGLCPSALEFMEREGIEFTLKYRSDLSFPLPDEAKAMLLIEVDGNSEEELMNQCEGITRVLDSFAPSDVWMATSASEKEALWKVRRAIGEAVKSHSIYKEEDTVVPRFQLPALLQKVKELGKTYGFESVCYGHAGDGNLHVNIIRGNLSQEAWENELPKAIRELFAYVKSLGGTLSGEHGIGWVQKNYMDIALSPAALNLMRGIKKLFDPTGILNPGKIFPDEDV